MEGWRESCREGSDGRAADTQWSAVQCSAGVWWCGLVRLECPPRLRGCRERRTPRSRLLARGARAAIIRIRIIFQSCTRLRGSA